MKYQLNLRMLILILFILLLVEFCFSHPHHMEFWWQKMKGFFIPFSLVISIAMMFGAKTLGRWFLYKKPDYYDKD